MYNEEMKLAAVYAIADLAKKRVPDVVNAAYGLECISFGPEYIIPKALDPRLLTTVAPAVAKAAIESGVARKKIEDWTAYQTKLEALMGTTTRCCATLPTGQAVSQTGCIRRSQPRQYAYGRRYSISRRYMPPDLAG